MVDECELKTNNQHSKLKNNPASSKFSMKNDWKIPERGENLFTFIGLINFYYRHAPYIENRLKTLRKLLKQYYRETITLMD